MARTRCARGGSRRADVRLPGDLVGAGPRLLGVHGVRLHSGTAPPPGPVALVLQSTSPRPAASRPSAATSSPTSGHELKTPVGALSLLAEAIEQAADDPEAVQRFAGRIAHEADRLGRLVRELIDLSRLQGGEPLPSSRRSTSTASSPRPSTAPAPRPAPRSLDIAVGGEHRPGRARGGEPAGHRRDQPAGERRRLQRGGEPDRGGRARPVGLRRDRRDRQRHRHPAQGPPAGLRALLPRRPVPGEQHRRHRPRPGHRQARGEQPRRVGVGVERGGPRLHVHPAHPAGRRTTPRTAAGNVPPDASKGTS